MADRRAREAGDVIPGLPSDNTTLLEVLEELRLQGYDGTMWVSQDGTLRCERCRAEVDPADAPVHEIRRLEGASDPDDMIAVVALECPACAMKATLVLHYGPEASAEEQDVLVHLERAAS
ncbi:MAG TPA: hypothetical protein VGZ52_04725 [Acidimicrobiales bacterium]|jgi:hypothetical protein|nr:hypothetical protein [Acidimicrobiales bacterium]